MLVIECLRWWYGRGWRWRFSKSSQTLSKWAEFFSTDDILRTLFAPYRQTLAGGSSMVQRLLDQVVSRLVGFMVRISLLIAAAFSLIIGGLGMIVVTLVWPIIPVLPAVAIILAVIEVKI